MKIEKMSGKGCLGFSSACMDLELLYCKLSIKFTCTIPQITKSIISVQSLFTKVIIC